jgi:hypothetical protein
VNEEQNDCFPYFSISEVQMFVKFIMMTFIETFIFPCTLTSLISCFLAEIPAKVISLFVIKLLRTTGSIISNLFDYM